MTVHRLVRRALLVRCIADREVFKTIDVTGKSKREVEKLEAGLLRNMDRDRFFVDRSETYTYDSAEMKLFINGELFEASIDMGPVRRRRPRRKG
jgi:hypothetical protein